MTDYERRQAESRVEGRYLPDAYVWRADEDPDGPWIP